MDEKLLMYKIMIKNTVWEKKWIFIWDIHKDEDFKKSNINHKSKLIMKQANGFKGTVKFGTHIHHFGDCTLI